MPEIKYRYSARTELNGCSKICMRYHAKKPLIGGRYSIGQSKCTMCGIFIWWKGLFCPCCGYRLRKQSRDSQWKKYPDSKRIE